LRYSASTFGGLTSTNSMSRLFSFAMTKRTVERELPYIAESIL
jgi:hypothetical protein